jgi:hypothetical protein
MYGAFEETGNSMNDKLADFTILSQTSVTVRKRIAGCRSNKPSWVAILSTCARQRPAASDQQNTAAMTATMINGSDWRQIGGNDQQ